MATTLARAADSSVAMRRSSRYLPTRTSETWSKPSETAGEPSAAVAKVLAEEAAAGLHTLGGHAGFEGHAVRLAPDGRITHLTAINAGWLLDRDGELTATLRDGRRLRLTAADVVDLLD